MQKWSEKSSFDMLLFLGEFETEFKYCNTAINDCLRIFSVGFCLQKGCVSDKLSDHFRNGNAGTPEGMENGPETASGRRS